MQLAGAPAVARLRAARTTQPRRSSLAVHAAASRKPKKPATRPQEEVAPSRGRPMQKAVPPPAPAAQPVNAYPPPHSDSASAAARAAADVAAAPPPSPARAAPPPSRAAYVPEADAEESIPSSEALPQVVSDRILGRIVAFSGLPLLLGFASGPLAYFYKISGKGELPKELLYTSGTAVFALAAAGISYGVLSASWDPRRPGSALGVEEFRNNLPIVLDRFFKKK